MNWYRKLKLAQIWDLSDIEDGGDLESHIVALYHLEYVMSMMSQRPFKGMPKRKENILSGVKKSLSKISEKLKSAFVNLFDNWLKSHALADPKQWAYMRLHGGDPEHSLFREEYTVMASFGNMMDEYAGWSDKGGGDPEITWREMMQHVSSDPGSYPSLLPLAQELAEERGQYVEQEISDMGLEAYNEMQGQEFQTPEQAIEALTPSAEDAMYDIDELYDYESFVAAIEERGLEENVLIEFYQNQIFPLWFAHWQPEGIEETRETVENVHGLLTQANSTGELMAALNLAINTVHQSGSMLDYFNDYSKSDIESRWNSDFPEILNELSAGGEYVKEWNDELREIGVQI